MRNNFIYRRQNTLQGKSYESVKRDFTELFEGYDGVDIQTSDGDEVWTKFNLSSSGQLYLMLVPHETLGARLSLHCGEGTKESESWMYIDGRTRSEVFAYSFVRTAYGVAFTIFSPLSDNKVSLSDGYFQCFFTRFTHVDGEQVNGFLYCNASKEDSIVNNTLTIATEYHERLESYDPGKCFFGDGANQTVLVNATSYTQPLVCEHLYKKLQTEGSKFGLIKLNNRLFVAGSHLCLEGIENDEQA